MRLRSGARYGNYARAGLGFAGAAASYYWRNRNRSTSRAKRRVTTRQPVRTKRRKYSRSKKKKTLIFKPSILSNSATGITYSGFKVNRSMGLAKRLIYKQHQPMTFERIDTARISQGTVGAQSANEFTIGSITDLDQWVNAGLGSTPGTTGTGIGTGRMLLHKIRMKWEITNQTNNNVEFLLYNVVPRENMPQHLSGYNYSSPIAAWDLQNTSLTGTTTVYGPLPNKNTPGNTPFYSAAFCKNYIVKSVDRVQMSAGATHVHNVTIYVNKWFTQTDVETSLNMLRNCSYTLVAVGRACATNDQTTNTLIGAGTFGANVLYNVTAQLYKDDESFRYVGLDDNQGAITTERVMSEYADLPVNVAYA